ncbi:hypothetical protein [Endozoicomonas sp. SCSIO W0465]|uniref:hypothetical protein n=1 Tax=Endozoicomonas sp. SCSIO W0465 TaxID=2918516 RepID=UPI002075DF96|nr:hypothetical protein [Endozoicomonas sp. SCSIO W0465]USE35052.1 hypothetical protein MJO57_23500 [Endozoicomonas sp. SCSIO W0465]
MPIKPSDGTGQKPVSVTKPDDCSEKKESSSFATGVFRHWHTLGQTIEKKLKRARRIPELPNARENIKRVPETGESSPMVITKIHELRKGKIVYEDFVSWLNKDLAGVIQELELYNQLHGLQEKLTLLRSEKDIGRQKNIMESISPLIAKIVKHQDDLIRPESRHLIEQFNRSSGHDADATNAVLASLKDDIDHLGSRIAEAGRVPILNKELTRDLQLDYFYSNCCFSAEDIQLLKPLKSEDNVIFHLKGSIIRPFVKESLKHKSPINALAQLNPAAVREAEEARMQWVLDQGISGIKHTRKILGRPQSLRQDLQDLQDLLNISTPVPGNEKQWSRIKRDVDAFLQDEQKKRHMVETSAFVMKIHKRLKALSLPERHQLTSWPSLYTDYISQGY